MRAMLVTGGTGAIGAELVRLLAETPPVDRIVVLTRAPSEPRRQRLLERWRATASGPVDYLAGSLESLARSAGDLRGEITHIAHLAADTRFAAPAEESRATNADGMRAVLDFARGCRRLSTLAVASTVYVAGLRTGRVMERELDHEAGFANPYEASKHDMERLARGAMGELPVSVYRLSTAIGDDGTGRVTSLNAFHSALQLMYGGFAPMIPGSADTPIDVISTNFAARALRYFLTVGFEPGRTYQLCAGEAAPALGEVLDTAMRAMRARRPAWRKRAIAAPALCDEATYDLFVRSVHESGHPMMIAATRAVESFARQLTRPKIFDTTLADAALQGVVERADPLGLCADVVGYCVENEWTAAA